jgi:hypothetical protein
MEEADKKTTNDDDDVDDDDAMKEETAPTIQYVGFGNAAKGPKCQSLSIQKILLTSLPAPLAETLAALPKDNTLPVVIVDNNAEMKQLMEDYKKECELRKARAEKFGTVYTEPAADAFVPWSKAKRLRENPEKGFATGLDMMDPEEVAKREARKARFGIKEGDNNDNDNNGGDDGGDEQKKKSNDLPVEQAWDKEEMLRPQRKEPPSSLWKQPSAVQEERDSFAMEQPEPIAWVPEKIHFFAIDWAAFKQIRNKDIMVSFF